MKGLSKGRYDETFSGEDDFTLLVGNYLGILSSAVFSKLIYYIVPSLSLSESQTVWIQIRSDILSVLIWF